MAAPSDQKKSIVVDTIVGILLCGITLFVIADEWGGPPLFAHLSALCSFILIVLLSIGVAWSRILFVIVGAVMAIVALMT
ncbi:MAG: hypothetical protein AAF362_20255, partial [Pseudomonadota bacterium]